MSPLERLLAEAIPTRPQPAEPRSPWTRDEQDAHWQTLCATVGTPNTPRPTQAHQQAA